MQMSSSMCALAGRHAAAHLHQYSLLTSAAEFPFLPPFTSSSGGFKFKRLRWFIHPNNKLCHFLAPRETHATHRGGAESRLSHGPHRAAAAAAYFWAVFKEPSRADAAAQSRAPPGTVSFQPVISIESMQGLIMCLFR